MIFFGAGLPQLSGLSGDAKSYAEPLFSYPKVGALGSSDALQAIKGPIEDEEEKITDDALKVIVEVTEGYPFFKRVGVSGLEHG